MQSLMADKTAGPNSACFEIGRPLRDVHVDMFRELAARTTSLWARWRLENNLPKGGGRVGDTLGEDEQKGMNRKFIDPSS